MPPSRLLVPSYHVQRLDASAPRELFRAVGELHVRLIHHGILEALGAHFVGTLYQELSRRAEVLVYAAVRDAAPVGFIAGSVNLVRSLRGISIRGMCRLAGIACSHLWRPHLLKKVVQTAGYFFRRTSHSSGGATAIEASTPGRSELLAIGVASEVQGQGVGKALVSAFEADLRAFGQVGRYFVSTNAEELGSNAFYQASGFRLVGQKPHHDLLLNVYVKELAP